MLRILIASHGKYAEGIYHAASIIVGQKTHVSYINAYVDDVPLKEKLEQYFAGTEANDEVIILTDLFGGSVNQAVLPYIQSGKIHVITGINLALVLELILRDPESSVDVNHLRSIVEESKKQLMYVNDSVSQQDNGDDFDF